MEELIAEHGLVITSVLVVMMSIATMLVIVEIVGRLSVYSLETVIGV